MIRGKDIEDLVKLFESRNVSLFHACQFSDFRSYLTVNGIPSRAYLQMTNQSFTSFETDAGDLHKGVWDKIFVNLSDFGETFARGGAAVPNPYGPILPQIRPAALHEATDVAICLRSAGARNFNRETEALKSIQTIDHLFRHPVEVGFPLSSQVKFRTELRKEYPGATDPEVSCTVKGGKLSMQYVIVAWVDTYVLGGKPLQGWVDWSKSSSDAVFPVRERYCVPARRAVFNELVPLLVSTPPSLQDLSQNLNVSQELRKWAQQVKAQKLEYQFKRFANYLREGTLLPLISNQPTR